MVRQSLAQNNFVAMKDTGVTAVGVDITTQTASEFVLMQQFSRFRGAAEKAGLHAYIRGIPSRSLAAAALGSGFYYLDGDAIAPPVKRPETIREFDLFDIYRSLVPA